MIPVFWVSMRDEIDARGYWDQTILEDLFGGRLGDVPGYTFEHDEFRGNTPAINWTGGIVVIPARHHAEHIEHINHMIENMPWVLLVLTGDEEGVFPIEEVRHPNIRFWVQNPVPGRKWPGDTVFLGCGYAHGKTVLDEIQRAIVEKVDGACERDLNYFFAGQVTNPRREQCVGALEDLDGGELVETEGFAQGLDRLTYYWNLRRAAVAPAPSGPFTTDTFRAFEALEAGAVPLLDDNDPHGRSGVWQLVFPEHLRPPTIVDWETVGNQIGLWRGVKQRNQVFSKWQRYKRHLRHELARHLHDLGAEPTGPWSAKTAVVVTSPSKLHPSTDMLRETLDSIRFHSPLCEILVMFDGVRPEAKKATDAYEEYVNRALHMINAEYQNVVPFVAKNHMHQSGLMRWALDEIRTPLVLFMEHDTPFRTNAWPEWEIPWVMVEDVVMSGMLNVARFHFEATIPWEHDHLMLDPGPIDILDVPFRRTAQWSQRPHLARTEFYRWLMATYFTPHSRCMIEDCVLGPAERGAHDKAEWANWRIGIYSPDGSLARTLHTDGRQGAPMYEMTFDYPGDPPPGAPQPGTRKVKD